jgi:hypothetical protein
MLGSVVGYFFSVITVFATVMTFILLIGEFDNSTFEKFRHYPRPIIEHPRPIIDRTVTPAPPSQEPHHIPKPEPHHILVALGTNEATAPKDLSAHDKNTKDTRAASIAKADAENRKPERKIKPKRLAHLGQPKVLARQRQNYEGHGYAMTLERSGGYSPGLDSQR